MSIQSVHLSDKAVRVLVEYHELLARLGIKTKPKDKDSPPIIFVIHEKTSIGTWLVDEMLELLEKDGVPVQNNLPKIYCFPSIKKAKMDPRIEEANVFLIFGDPDISEDAHLYPELRAIWEPPA